MRCGFDFATLTLFHQIVGDDNPRGWNVTPLSVDEYTSLGRALSAVATQISPVGEMSSASIQMSEMLPGSPIGFSAVAVAHVQPPSRLTRRPVNVVAKIVPSLAIAYFGSNSPP